MSEAGRDRRGRAGATPPPAGCEAPAAYLFKRQGAGQYCLSVDRTGANIPRGLNGEGWTYIRDFAFAPGEYRLALDAELAAAELDRTGYYLLGDWYDAR